tara:strand:- start:468 stop:752 length:285 start_codon:yes stop_codon:yes gene_type:complete
LIGVFLILFDTLRVIAELTPIRSSILKNILFFAMDTGSGQGCLKRPILLSFPFPVSRLLTFRLRTSEDIGVLAWVRALAISATIRHYYLYFSFS